MISNIDLIKEELLLRVIDSSNIEYAKKIIAKIKFNKFYLSDNKFCQINNDEKKTKIINGCINNNLDNLIIYMIVNDKIDIIKNNNYTYNLYGNDINYDYSNTFIELLFIKGKKELFFKIINNDLILKNYIKSNLVFAGLCLSIAYKRLEIFIELLENYKHCIESNKLFETFKYSDNLERYAF